MTSFRSGKFVAILIAAIAFFGVSSQLDAQLQSSTAKVMATGTGWRLIDADPEATVNEMSWEVSPSGVASLPVSQAQKDIVYQAFADDPGSGTIFMSQELLAAMEDPSFPAGYESYIDLKEKSLIGCSWKTETRNRSYPFSESLYDWNLPFSGAVTGQLAIDFPLSGNVTLAVTYKIRKCLGIPVGWRFVSATASGNASIAGTGDLNATASASAIWEKEWKLAEPYLGDVSFTVGPVPVRLEFTLPIYAGARFEAGITGQVSAHLDATASGTFNYTCTQDDCTGTSSFTDQFEFTGPTASVSVDLKAQAHGRVMLRVGIYDSSIAYVEGGLKAYAKAGIWGYYGNACGDADGNGSNETVQALVADLNWGYKFAYGLGGWLLPDRLYYTGGNEYYLGWRDLLGAGGSTALQPMILGPSSVTQGATATYTVKMRPCYPYANAVNFTVTPTSFTGGAQVTPPSGTATVSGSFASAGNQTLTVRATTDTFGRNLQIPYSRTISVASNLPPAPTAPSGLSTTVLSSTSIRLNWLDNANNETAVEVQRRLSPSGVWGSIATLGANAVTYTDTSVAGGTAYDYRVRATNAGGASAWSNTSTATTPAPAPNAPSGLTASWNSSTQRLVLGWTDNANNETGFTVQFSYSGSAFSDMATVGANVTSYTSGPNPPLGSYQFRVRAYNAAGASAWSNTASVVAMNTPTTSIAWIQKAEVTWGPAGTLTAAGYAAGGTGNVTLVWRERSSAGVWGSWTTVAYQATVSPDTTWSNTISSGNPTDACHWFDAYTIYSGVTSATFHYTGAPGCP